MNGIENESGRLSANRKTRSQSVLNLEQKQNSVSRGKTGRGCETILRFYDKSCGDFKVKSIKKLAWKDVAKQVGLQTGMYCSSEYRFICLMFSLVRIMAAVFSGFSVWVLITLVLCLLRRYLRKKKQRLAECRILVKMERDLEYENTRNI